MTLDYSTSQTDGASFRKRYGRKWSRCASNLCRETCPYSHNHDHGNVQSKSAPQLVTISFAQCGVKWFSERQRESGPRLGGFERVRRSLSRDFLPSSERLASTVDSSCLY